MENSTDLQKMSSVDRPIPSDMNNSWAHPSVRNKSYNELTPSQQSVVQENINIYDKQKEYLEEFKQNARLTPPSYPILISVKYYNTRIRMDKISYIKYWLLDNNNDYIFASSFQDASAKVKIQIKNPASKLQNDYKRNFPGCNYLRMSSDNVKIPLQVDNFNLVRNSNYQYWKIITTSNAPSFLSNMRQSFSSARQSMRGGKKNRKSIKSKKSRKTKRRIR